MRTVMPQITKSAETASRMLATMREPVERVAPGLTSWPTAEQPADDRSAPPHDRDDGRAVVDPPRPRSPRSGGRPGRRVLRQPRPRRVRRDRPALAHGEPDERAARRRRGRRRRGDRPTGAPVTAGDDATAPSAQDTFRRSAAKHPTAKEAAPAKRTTAKKAAKRTQAAKKAAAKRHQPGGRRAKKAAARKTAAQAGGAQEGRRPDRAGQPAVAEPDRRGHTPVATRDSPCIVWRVGSASRPSSLAQAVSTSVMAKPRSSNGASAPCGPGTCTTRREAPPSRRWATTASTTGRGVVRVVDGRLQDLGGVGVEEALRAAVDDQRRAQPRAVPVDGQRPGTERAGGTGRRRAAASRTPRAPALGRRAAGDGPSRTCRAVADR